MKNTFRSSRSIFLSLACALGLQLISTAAHAQFVADLWDRTKAKTNKILDEGKTEVYLAGYTYHGRHTYTAERISELNEKTWGVGIGKAIRDKDGDEHSLNAMVISDSHFKPQWSAGYSFQYKWNLGPVETGLGYSAFLMSRQDLYHSIPFPAILPVASIGTKNFSLMFTYVPRVSRNLGNGDVLFIFSKITLD
jgi:palmitoyl transferase